MSQFKQRAARALGYLARRLFPDETFLPDATPEELQLIREVRPYSMTSLERLHGLIHAVRHVVEHKLEGDIVECGVWRGGSMMVVAKTLLALGAATRPLHLYDTFAGMTQPGAKDSSRFERQSAAESYAQSLKDGEVCHWAYASLEDARANVLSTGYPSSLLHFVKGPVEQTLPAHAPERIALLRLDTDFYGSTKHELEHLFPRLVRGGVLILDDYGHWEGQRIAVEEYLREHPTRLLLCRIDYTGRMAVKQE